MKTFTKKYTFYIDGTNTLIDEQEIPASLFWQMKAELDKRVQDSIDNDDTEDYKIEKFEDVKEHATFTTYHYRYVNCGASTGLFMYVCKPGYHFKKKGEA